MTTSDSPYSFGASVRLRVTIKVADVLTDPSGLTLTYKAPGQSGITTVTMGALTHESAGTYSYVVVAAVAGEWHYRFVSTGSGAGAAEDEFQVRRLETV